MHVTVGMCWRGSREQESAEFARKTLDMGPVVCVTAHAIATPTPPSPISHSSLWLQIYKRAPSARAHPYPSLVYTGTQRSHEKWGCVDKGIGQKRRFRWCADDCGAAPHMLTSSLSPSTSKPLSSPKQPLCSTYAYLTGLG